MNAHGTWTLTWQGLRTVTGLEMRQRLRSTKWKIALLVWFLVMTGLTLLTTGSIMTFTDGFDKPSRGPVVFGIVVFFVMLLGLLVTPTLAATSINGDRNAGTLATLQVTLLSPLEIVLGKLFAAWFASLAFLATSIPFLAWGIALGGVRVAAAFTTLAVLAIMLAVVCSFSLFFSAIATKAAVSAVLSYLMVATLCLGSVIFFALMSPLVSVDEKVPVQNMVPVGGDPITEEDWENVTYECVESVETMNQFHSERIWWLLAPNPFVIVADAAPAQNQALEYSLDPLTGIREGVRAAYAGPPAKYDWCDENDDFSYSDTTRASDMAPVWPWGLGSYLVLATGSVILTVRKLALPVKKLSRGTRIA